MINQRTLTIGGSITLRLTCLTGLDLTKGVKLLLIQHKLLNPSKIIRRSAVQRYFPLSLCSLTKHITFTTNQVQIHGDTLSLRLKKDKISHYLMTKIIIVILCYDFDEKCWPDPMSWTNFSMEHACFAEIKPSHWMFQAGWLFWPIRVCYFKTLLWLHCIKMCLWQKAYIASIHTGNFIRIRRWSLESN